LYTNPALIPGAKDMTAPLYDIPVRRIDGADASLAEYNGSVLLVVNVASACGLTPQYESLERIYQSYRGRGLQVLGFPANDFGAQEPGSNEEIKEFCMSKFGVKFPMFAKLVTKGEGQHPLYRHLVSAQPKAEAKADSALKKTLEEHGLGPKNDTDIMWNFEKFIVSRHGEVVRRFAPDITPDDPLVISAIEDELAKT
jgi:glutathione peroxidase